MTDAQGLELCHVSVFGPRARADLAVPVTVSVMSLLPVLLQHTGEPDAASDSWVLQRLGEAPLDPSGTPESLDWKEGEQFHLRPRNDPLPELDFDDIVDGMATMVGRSGRRWKPEFNRWLFFGFAVSALLVFAWVVLNAGPSVDAAVATGSAAIGLLGAAVAVAISSEDRLLLHLFGLGGCGFAFLTGVACVSGQSAPLDLLPTSLLIGSAALIPASGVLLAARLAWAPMIPFVSFGAVMAVGVAGVGTLWLHVGLGLSPIRTSALAATVIIGLLVFAPRISIRLARIRGPQLPRTADELQFDIEPAPAAQVERRTGSAEGYLTIVALTAAVVLAGAIPVLVGGGFFADIQAALVAVATILRSRGLRGIWQRVSLAVAGAEGLTLVALRLIAPLTPNQRMLCGVGVALVFFLLVLAMLRRPPRRLLPIWGHLSDWAETLSAVALVPILLQLFGLYVWASGLAR